MWPQTLDLYRATIRKLTGTFTAKVSGMPYPLGSLVSHITVPDGYELTLPYRLRCLRRGNERVFDEHPTADLGFVQVETARRDIRSAHASPAPAKVSHASCVSSSIEESECSDNARARFEEVFRYDDNGLPQIWQQGENMDEIFVKAKAVAEELVTLFARIPLPSDLAEEETVTGDAVCAVLGVINLAMMISLLSQDFDSDAQAIILLTPSRQRDLRDRLKKDADSIFLDAKRGAVTSLSEVPRGMWLLLFAFGFNEIYTFVSFILSNPFLLVLLVVVATTVAVLYQSGMLGPLMRAGWMSAGPATRVVVASVGPLLETVFTGLAAFLQQLSEKMRPEGQTQSGRGDSMSAVDSDSTSSSPLRAHTPSSSVVGSSMPSTPRPKTGAAGGDGAPMSSVASRIISLTPFGTPVKRK